MTGRILLVDDDVDLLDLYEMYLSMHGHTVTRAACALDALDALSVERPDVMLLDVRMPEINGFDLVRMLRAAGHDFPICMHTADASDDALDVAATLDVQDVLLKPQLPEDVLSCLEKAMAQTDSVA